MVGAEPGGESLLDVSRPLTAATPVWPGDRRLELGTMVDGSTRISWFSGTCHLGTHLDAPLHFDPSGAPVERGALDRLVGPADVLRLDGARGTIAADALPQGWRPGAPRLLLRTDSWPLGEPVGPGFAALSVELVERLHGLGVVTVGLDTPSVDPFESTTHEAHLRLAGLGMTWIEGLWLGAVEPGRYELIALPLALVGVEAAPVRAVLRRRGE